MNIQINDRFRIVSDGSHNFIVQENKLIKSSKDGVEDRYEWRDVGYHGKALTAFTTLIDHMALRSEATSLDELIQEIQTFRIDVINAIQGMGATNK